MKSYYYLVTSLKDLYWGMEKSPYAPEDLIQNIKDSIIPEDFEIIKLFLHRFDNKNLISLIDKKDEFSPLGIFSRDELEEEIKVPVRLPDYMKKFLENMRLEKGSFSGFLPENQLEIFYHEYLINFSDKFVNEYASFDFSLRNFLVAFNGRKFKLDLSANVLPINEESANLSSSQSVDFGLSVYYPWVQDVLRILEEKNILEIEKKLDKLRFETLGSIVTFEYFNIRVVLAYLIRFFIIHRWANIDREKGIGIFREITHNLVDGAMLSFDH